MHIRVKLNEGTSLPHQAYAGDAGFDLSLRSLKKVYFGSEEQEVRELNDELQLQPQERVLVGTGTFFEIPEGYEMQIRPRSGLSLKTGLMISNSPGTIDSGYRNEVGVILFNPTNQVIKLKLNERIAQGVITKVETNINFIKVDNLDTSERDLKGFGSSGTSQKLQ